MEDDRGVAGSQDGDDRVTRSVYFHIGAPKSGTTYLQSILDGNRERLADAGVLVVGEQHVDRVQAGLQVREDPRWQQLPEHRRDMWGVLLRQIEAWNGPAAVLSYELFSAATADQAARALADLAAYDVHVVITARDLSRAVPSAWQERLKFGATDPLEEWRPPTGRRSEWGWRTTDPAEVARRWGRTLPADHLHVVTVPRGRADETLLWRRFAEACSLPEVALDLDTTRANESLGAVEAELLRRANAHLRPPLEGSRERAVWLRDLLAHRVLAPLGSERLGLTDAQFEEAAARAEAAIEEIGSRGYAVHGDLEDLRATRSQGRLPSQIGDGELLESALQAMVELLVLVREAAHADPEPAGRPGPKQALQRAAQRLAGPYVRRRDQELRDRISFLEAEVARSRELHQRVAVLDDLVTELLMPAPDGALARAALRRYRERGL